MLILTPQGLKRSFADLKLNTSIAHYVSNSKKSLKLLDFRLYTLSPFYIYKTGKGFIKSS